MFMGLENSTRLQMASTIFYHFNAQIEKFNKCQLFRGIDGFANGEQKEILFM